jgi:hypothetical protein
MEHPFVTNGGLLDARGRFPIRQGIYRIARLFQRRRGAANLPRLWRVLALTTVSSNQTSASFCAAASK